MVHDLTISDLRCESASKNGNLLTSDKNVSLIRPLFIIPFARFTTPHDKLTQTTYVHDKVDICQIDCVTNLHSLCTGRDVDKATPQNPYEHTTDKPNCHIRFLLPSLYPLHTSARTCIRYKQLYPIHHQNRPSL